MTATTRSSIALWCVVSAAEYPLLGITMRGLLEHDAVEVAVVVHTGVQRPSDFGALASQFYKVREFHRDFGEGFSKSLSDGGYDQLSARNYALREVENCGVEWLVQFDADDYYDPDLFSIIAHLGDQYDAVTCSCYTLTSDTNYWYESGLERRIRGKKVFDPHTRIWRASLRKRFELCPIASTRYANITRHCGVDFAHHPYWHFHIEEEPFHFHLHCLLRKRHTEVRRASRPLGVPINQPLRECLYQLSNI